MLSEINADDHDEDIIVTPDESCLNVEYLSKILLSHKNSDSEETTSTGC